MQDVSISSSWRATFRLLHWLFTPAEISWCPLCFLCSCFLTTSVWRTGVSCSLFELHIFTVEEDERILCLFFPCLIFHLLNKWFWLPLPSNNSIQAYKLLYNHLCTVLDIRFHLCSHYYITMNIGDPAKPYFLDVDTGSDLTWLQCDAPCQSCNKVQLVTQCCLLIVQNCINNSSLAYMDPLCLPIWLKGPVIMVFMSEWTLCLCCKKTCYLFWAEVFVF